MEHWYILNSDGRIYALGKNDNFDAAETAAADQGYDPVWIFGEETFADWRDTLTSMKGV